jgi:hypothetical protein
VLWQRPVPGDFTVRLGDVMPARVLWGLEEALELELDPGEGDGPRGGREAAKGREDSEELLWAARCDDPIEVGGVRDRPIGPIIHGGC